MVNYGNINSINIHVNSDVMGTMYRVNVHLKLFMIIVTKRIKNGFSKLKKKTPQNINWKETYNIGHVGFQTIFILHGVNLNLKNVTVSKLNTNILISN